MNAHEVNVAHEQRLAAQTQQNDPAPHEFGDWRDDEDMWQHALAEADYSARMILDECIYRVWTARSERAAGIPVLEHARTYLADRAAYQRRHGASQRAEMNEGDCGF
jgi:hypothetical protein